MNFGPGDCGRDCYTDEQEAENDCVSVCQGLLGENFFHVSFLKLPCTFGFGSESQGCGNWDPSNEVSISGQVRHIDETFLVDPIRHPRASMAL